MSLSPASSERRVVTFYSYKGGTGRSMALANVAWLLAFSGRRVLVVDWDLEAPGVHRYFHPFLEDKDLTATDGLFDFIENLASRSAATPEPLAPKDVNILDYITLLSWPAKSGVTWERFGPRARIDLLSAGRQGPFYSRRLNSFSWIDFYERLKGRQLLGIAREQLRGIYDYVLIDSRTGVSDTSGICTVDMPDTLVVCFTLNDQSISGASGVAESVVNERNARLVNTDFRETRQIRVFPVPMRVEVQSEKLKRDVALKLAEERFASFVAHLNEPQRRDYWGSIQAHYIPFYAFEEIPAVFGDAWSDRLALVNRFRQLANRLVGGDSLKVGQFADDFERSEALRKTFLAAYLRSGTTLPDGEMHRAKSGPPLPVLDAQQDAVRFFISYASEDKEIASALYDELREIDRNRVHCFLDLQAIDSGVGWGTQLREQIEGADWLICVYTGKQSEFSGYEVGVFTEINKLSPSKRVSCLYNKEPLPAVFRQFQNHLVVLPPTAESTTSSLNEESFYARAPLARFFSDVYHFKNLYAPRGASEAARQTQTLVRQVKQITEAFKSAGSSDVVVSTPTQLGIEIVVHGTRHGSLSLIPDDSLVGGTYQSLGILGLMPAFNDKKRVPETTWRAVREASGVTSWSKWMVSLERHMLSAANGMALDGQDAVFASRDQRVFRAVLSRHIQYDNGDHKFEVTFVETTPRQFLGTGNTSMMLAGLLIESRFRSAYLEDPDDVAGKFSDTIPLDIFERNCWQLRYDLDRSQQEAIELGVINQIEFVRAFGKENREAAERLLMQSAASREALLMALPDYGDHVSDMLRPNAKAAVGKFLRTFAATNSSFLRLSVDAYRNELLRQLECASDVGW